MDVPPIIRSAGALPIGKVVLKFPVYYAELHVQKRWIHLKSLERVCQCVAHGCYFCLRCRSPRDVRCAAVMTTTTTRRTEADGSAPTCGTVALVLRLRRATDLPRSFLPSPSSRHCLANQPWRHLRNSELCWIAKPGRADFAPTFRRYPIVAELARVWRNADSSRFWQTGQDSLVCSRANAFLTTRPRVRLALVDVLTLF